MNDVSRLFVESTDPMGRAAEIIRKEPESIAIVVNENCGLEATVTDPLLRTALLSGRRIDDPVRYCMYTTPDFDRSDRSEDYYQELMVKYGIQQLPLLDEQDRVCGVATRPPAWVSQEQKPLVVLMAGGLGTRLSPLTDTLPKPMIDIDGKPLLHIILDRFKSAGFSDFAISVNYLADVIEDYFADGSKFGVNIEYIREDRKLGTAGALSLIDVDPDRPVFVVNGDFFCDLDFASMMNFHVRRGCDATIAVNTYSEQIQYGVITVSDGSVEKIEEKPVIDFLANAGAYIIQGDALRQLPKNEFFNMPTLLNKLAGGSGAVQAYPLHEFWLDIGAPRELEKARQWFANRSQF